MGTRHRPWLTALLARRPTKIAAIKLARTAWAMMARHQRYQEPPRFRRKLGTPRDVMVGKDEQHSEPVAPGDQDNPLWATASSNAWY